MTGNNPKLGLVNADVHTKFGQILSLHSKDIEWKPKYSQNHRKTERWRDGKTEGQGKSSIAPLFQSGAIIKGRNSVKILHKKNREQSKATRSCRC